MFDATLGVLMEGLNESNKLGENSNHLEQFGECSPIYGIKCCFKMMYAAYSGCLYSRLVCEIRLRVKTRSAVERPGVNPLCALLRFCSMVDFMRLRSTCANVFPGTNKRVRDSLSTRLLIPFLCKVAGLCLFSSLWVCSLDPTPF